MKSHSYAKGTVVSIGRTREEIEHTLERFGATHQLWMRDDEQNAGTLAFRRERTNYRFLVHLPSLEQFSTTPTSKQTRAQTTMEQMQQAENRRLFRSLANYIKAMLDAIDSGIITAEEALLPYQILPGGQTIFERAQLQLRSGDNIDLLPALGAGRTDP